MSTRRHKHPSRISVVINTLNEEKEIGGCIASVSHFADEILVCDMQSDDATRYIAEKLGARVVSYPRGKFVTAARRYACEEAKGEWIFMLDADERPTRKLLSKYADLVERRDVDCVVCAVVPYMFGDFVYWGGWYEVQFPRFFRKRIFLDNFKPENGEMPHMDFLAAAAANQKVFLPKDYYLIHYNYDTVQEFVERTLGRYAAIEGEARAKRGEQLSWTRTLKNLLLHVYNGYVKGKGYKDGRRGLVLTLLIIMYKLLIEINIWFYATQPKAHREGQVPKV